MQMQLIRTTVYALASNGHPPRHNQSGWYSINLPRRDGRLSWPRRLWWVRAETVCLSTHSSFHYRSHTQRTRRVYMYIQKRPKETLKYW